MGNTFEIELNGEVHEGRCTFMALKAFEEKCGPVIENWRSMAENRLKLTTIATAVWAAINGERAYQGMKSLPYEVVGEMVHKHGFTKCAHYAGEFFNRSLPQGDGESSEDSKKKSE